MNPLPASKALDAYFLEARCRLLDLAAILDRLSRGDGAADVESDPRTQKIEQALKLIVELDQGRTEAIQKLFSQDYDPNWVRPEPR